LNDDQWSIRIEADPWPDHDQPIVGNNVDEHLPTRMVETTFFTHEWAFKEGIRD